MSPVSPDSVAQDQIRAFVDRILRLKEEVKAIQGDIREVYAEAKGNGFDKTALGKLVNYVEKRTSDADALAEQDALFDLYLEAYDSASHTRAYARGTKFDADGVVTEPDAAMRPQTGPVDRRDSSSNAGVVAVASPATNSRIAEGVSQPLAQGDVEPSSAGTEGGEDRQSLSDPVTISPLAVVTVEAGRESATDPGALPAARLDRSKPHPDCHDPEDCGLASWTHMCGSCLRARAAKAAGMALQ